MALRTAVDKSSCFANVVLSCVFAMHSFRMSAPRMALHKMLERKCVLRLALSTAYPIHLFE